MGRQRSRRQAARHREHEKASESRNEEQSGFGSVEKKLGQAVGCEGMERRVRRVRRLGVRKSLWGQRGGFLGLENESSGWDGDGRVEEAWIDTCSRTSSSICDTLRRLGEEVHEVESAFDVPAMKSHL